MLDWLEKHGEVFLRKNVGIGRNLQKSRVYQKSHETFEGVVQVELITLYGAMGATPPPIIIFDFPAGAKLPIEEISVISTANSTVTTIKPGNRKF